MDFELSTNWFLDQRQAIFENRLYGAKLGEFFAAPRSEMENKDYPMSPCETWYIWKKIGPEPCEIFCYAWVDCNVGSRELAEFLCQHYNFDKFE